jgi:hypothetical protein
VPEVPVEPGLLLLAVVDVGRASSVVEDGCEIVLVPATEKVREFKAVATVEVVDIPPTVTVGKE